MMFRNIAASIAGTSKRLGFLRRNLFLLLAWPMAALILVTVGWTTLLTRLDNEKARAENAALYQAAGLARSYADQIDRTIETIDQHLLHLKYEWRLSNGRMRLEDIQKAGILIPAGVLEVDIFDADGALLTSTHHESANVAARSQQYFAVHKAAADDFLYIGEPGYSPISNRYVVPFTRRLEDADGNFNGVVKIAAVPDYLATSYDEASFGQHGLLGVLGVDGLVRVLRIGQTTHPPAPQAFASVPVFEPPHGGSRILNGTRWFVDKRTRFVGWDAVKQYPLIALAGLDEQEALAPYRTNRAAAINAATWNTAAVAAFAFIAMGLSMGLAWRKYKMELTQASYRMATEEGHEGFYIAHPVRDAAGTIVDFQIIDSNHRGAELLRERRDELIGKNVSGLYEHANPERLLTMLRLAAEKGLYEKEIEVPGESPLNIRWAHIKMVRADGGIAVTLRDISETKAHVAELERRGNEDALTGLPNRHWVTTYLPRALQHAGQNDAMLALLFVDLDGFKKVNDTAGHGAGDEVLRSAARRIKDAIRPHDQVVRLGGDEFLVILEQIEQKTDAAHVAERVVEAFRQCFKTTQGTHSVGTSIGISIFPEDGTDAETLLHNGDIAMYSVKTSGKGSYRFYDRKFYEALRTRLQQEAELRRAIEQDQFIVYYQPRVNIATGATCSMEALVRWMHPEKGLLEPLEFIPLAEDTGLIFGLGELVIDKVCAQIAFWGRNGQELVPVSVNVTSRQFNEVDIANTLSACLARHHVAPRLVEVEITESSMMGDGIEVSRALTAIRKMGIKLLVDDFGTGYSSLSQLHRLDFDMLKVDRAFTADLGKTERGSVFFKAIVTMAHALGMRVVAEGVENEDQIKILTALLCDEMQGFYISKPLPPSDKQPILPKNLFSFTA